LKLKILLITAFIAITAIPMFIGLQYLNKQSGDYATIQFENHLTGMSLIAKKRILAAVDRIRDNTASISSRTQMRISLKLWNQTRGDTHLKKINRIVTDANHGLTLVKNIDIYDIQEQLIISTSVATAVEAIDFKKTDKINIFLTTENNEMIAVSQAPLIIENVTVGYIQIKFYTDFIIDLVNDRTGLGKTGEWLIAVRHENGDALFAVPLKYGNQGFFKRRVAKERVDIPITQALLGKEVLMHSAPDYHEQPVLASTRYLPDLDWGLVAKVNMSEVNQLVAKNNFFISIAEIIIILVAVLVGILLALFIAKPIELLSAHTAKVSTGYLESPPRIGGWKEVKELTEHFAFMISAVRSFNEKLQAEVDERTRELHDANQKLELLATQDPLTGLNNRRKLDEVLSFEFDRGKRYNKPIVVAILDIDHFKLVNDTYGHATGDEVLKKIAECLSSSVRSSDLAARIGGEEFCLVLPESKPEHSLTFLDRLRIDISRIEFTANDEYFNITCSFGVAYQNEAVETQAMLINNADQALYHAKKNGRNCVSKYTDI
jgi:diguanylate cyclase (GGDEF)-like protein